MDNQLYAKVGVVLLLGLNVGAYYFFWPRQNQGIVNQAKAGKEEKRDSSPVLKAPEVAKPKELAQNALKDATPLPPPQLVKPTQADDATPDQLVQRLMEHMKKEKSGEGVLLSPPPIDSKKPDSLIPSVPEDLKPRLLPAIEADPLPKESRPIDPPKEGITSPLAPKPLTSPWQLQTEPVGKQTLLIAKLHNAKGVVAEFRILCERVEPKGHEVIATGNAAFTGAGIRGNCGQLTLSLSDARITFDGNVRITSEVGGNLKGERISWEFAPLSAADSGVTPATLGPPN